jgi:protein-tyrosine phosphatase
VRVLLVCMGNICRSPTAEGVLRAAALQAGLPLEIDSAGTHDYHIGEPPDHRTAAAAKRRGIDLSALRARQVCDADFECFDLILAMDRDNLAWLRSRADPKFHDRIQLILDYAKQPETGEVPDPYYGGPTGFEKVLDLLADASQGLLAALASRLRG